MSDSAIADLVEEAANRIAAAHARSAWHCAIEVGVWQEINGRFFIRQVVDRLKERDSA